MGPIEFKTSPILVIGDLMLDRYWNGATNRISPEAPVPVVNKGSSEYRLGGAANVAFNLSQLGANAAICGLIGMDAEGKKIIDMLNNARIANECSQVEHFKTITKLRIMSRNQQLLRVDTEEPASTTSQHIVYQNASKLLKKASTLIISDYGKQSFGSIEQLILAARSLEVPVLIDPKGDTYQRYRGATLLTPNLSEFCQVVGECRSDSEIFSKAEKLIQDIDLTAMVVTLSERGVAIIEKDREPVRIPAKAREVYDVTGAGDTLIATLGAFIDAGYPIQESAKAANLAASLVVSKLGTATVSSEELNKAVTTEPDKSILSEDELMKTTSSAKALGERIVMTNGCFDLLHPGHIDYLQKAAEMGDKLIVAVNTDASIKRLKGTSRPINSLEDRMKMLAGIKGIDWVCSFDEDTPKRLIEKLLPDILVKGSDYQTKDIVGYKEVIASGGKVETIDFTEGYSSTKLIERIKNI